MFTSFDLLFFSPGSSFTLKVQVDDALSRQRLSRAAVDVYINYTRSSSALTGEDGGVLLHVPLQTGLPVVLVVHRDGYVSTLLPCKTRRMPSKTFIELLMLNKVNLGQL